jgi:hypothetical protein
MKNIKNLKRDSRLIVSLFGLIMALCPLVGETTELPPNVRSYSGNEFDGEWKGKATGSCRSGSYKIQITGAIITGTYLHHGKSGTKKSTVKGVIHADYSVDMALKKIASVGRESAPSGKITKSKIIAKDIGGNCVRSISIKRKG